MEHVFQVECWEKHSSGCSFQLLWLKEIGKGFEKEKWHFGTLIYENNGNQEKRKMKGHRLHMRIKLKENNGKLRKQRPH